MGEKYDAREGTFTQSDFKESGACLLAYAGDRRGYFGEGAALPASERPNREAGRLYHEIMAVYVMTLVEQQTAQSIPEMAGIAHRLIHGDVVASALPDVAQAELAELCISTATKLQLDWEHVVLAEKRIEVPIGDIIFSGKPDLLIVNGDYGHLYDWKSDRRVRTEEEVKADFQLRSYCLTAKQEVPEIRYMATTMFFGRYGVERTVTYDPDDFKVLLGGVARDIAARAAALDAQFDADGKLIPDPLDAATPGSWCDWCDFPLVCPKYLEAVNAGHIVDSDATAKARAGELAILDAVRKAKRKALEEWSNTHGAVVANGLAWGYRTKTFVKLPPAEVFPLMREAGVDPATCITISGKGVVANVEKAFLAKASPEQVQALVALKVETTGTEFRSVKAKGE